MLTPMPKFETEADEAEWWYEQREVLADEFLKLMDAGAKPGPSRSLQLMAEMRGVTVEELRAQHYAKQAKSNEPEALTKLPRSA